MSTINVFLGGSGKYVAEELKGLRTHYELALPEFIAFDLSRESTHTGAFALGHDLLAPHEQFADRATDDTAPAWERLGAGAGLDPQSQLPGPDTRPEAAVMSQTAREMRSEEPPVEGLWGLRAAGLLAFAAFMDPDATGPEADAARRFTDRVQYALRAAGRDGQRVTVNIVASTAGGTGAGMFLPFSLWLAEHSLATDLETNLILIASSAFDNEPLDTGENQLEMQSKGRTGTFAIIRELELLYQQDPWTTFPVRRFPIATGNATNDLRYRLGSRPFHRVYWMGRRSRDGEARKDDVYRETDPLLRILSNEAAVNDLDGMTGAFPQRLLPSVVTVDYPRLARARRLSSRLAQAALRHLVQGEDRPKLGRRFFEYPGNNPGAFGKFLQDNESRALAVAKGGETTIRPSDMDNLVKPFTTVTSAPLDFTGIDTGSNRTRAGYDAGDEDWQAYCASLTAALKQRWTQHEEHIEQHVREEIRTEGNRFRAYVTEVAAEYLNPEEQTRGPYPLSALQTQIEELKTDVAAVRTFFGHGRGIEGRLPGGSANQARYQSAAGISRRIADQENALHRPPEPRTTGGLTLGSWLLLFLVAVGVGIGAYFVVGLFPGNASLLWLSVVVASLATAGLMYRQLRGSRRDPLAQRRQREERRLFRLYEDRVFAHTGQALFSAITESFVPRAQEGVDALESRVTELRDVYAELLANAQARAGEVHTQPLHSVAEVGRDLSDPEIQTPEFLGALASRVRIDPQASDDSLIRDLSFSIAEGDGQAATGLVRLMAADIRERRRQANGEQLGAASRGGLDLSAIDAAVDSAATTALARHLPRTLDEALRREAGDAALATLDGHLAALVHKTPSGTPLAGQDRRRSSVDCNESDATVKRLYVPSVDVQGLVVSCVFEAAGGTLARSVRDELSECMGSFKQPLVVPELGASIALLSLWAPSVSDCPWAPNSIMATQEAHRAHDTYYGVSRDARSPGFIGASQRNFHILPELSAAAAIEADGYPLQPLLPCVAARLLGSHPHEEGPTILELFYLLRVDEVIGEQVSRDRVSSRRSSWEIRSGGAALPLIERPLLAGTSAQDNAFGPGLRVVNAFDAFHDFMLFEGAMAGGLIRQQWQVVEFSGAELPLEAWARHGNAELANLQRQFVERWWEVGSRDVADLEHEAMLQLLRQDVDLMDSADASRDWQRAVEFVLRSGNKRRRALASSAS